MISLTVSRKTKLGLFFFLSAKFKCNSAAKTPTTLALSCSVGLQW